MRSLITSACWFTLCFLSLAACSTEPTAVSNDPTASPTTIPATETATPTGTTAVNTSAPAPTTATPTAVLPTPTATTMPSPTATMPGLIGPDQFPPDVNPLTGERVANPELLARRPLAIKVSNAPALVRPQNGLNSADLVFEHLAETGLTRFTAVFYSQDAETVGSIRSGRLIDLEIPVMYDAAFAYSGAVGPVRLMFRDSPFFERIISPDFAHGGFYREEAPDKAFEHTLFTNTYTLRFILEERGQERPPQFQNGMAFRDEPVALGAPAHRIEIRYPATNATWFYSNGRYQRWTDGEPHLDANTGQQISFKNVIVLAAHHEATDIEEDAGGNPSLQIQIWGEGPVSVFRDGQRIDGRWHRDDSSHMLTFTDLDSNILALAPGNSFFQIVPLGFDQLTVTP